MTTMLAARAHRGSAALVLEEIPIPEPGPLDVVVKVASAGLAPGMMRLLEMGPSSTFPPRLATKRPAWSRPSAPLSPGSSSASGCTCTEPQLPQLRLLPDGPRHDVRAAGNGRSRRVQQCPDAAL